MKASHHHIYTIVLLLVLQSSRLSSVVGFTFIGTTFTDARLTRKSEGMKSKSLMMVQKKFPQSSSSSSTTLYNEKNNEMNVLTEMANSSMMKKAFYLSTSVSVLASATVAMAADEYIEVAELPPPYVPILFAIGILGGVGWLTGSLGDVMTEEASLGLMSGAKAKKEKERSRSSYFKNGSR